MRVGRDERGLQNWPWMPGDFSPHSHFKNSCWWKEICCSWLTPWLQDGLSMGVAALCPIDPAGNEGAGVCSESCFARGGTHNIRFCSG